MRKKDLLSFGYRKVDHAGYSWIANKEGARFLLEIDDWSPQALAARKGWNHQNKRHHTVYFGRDLNGTRYLIKFYLKGKERKYFYTRSINRARNEFFKSLLAHRMEIKTVLPLAVGACREERYQGLIIYPFLDQAMSLERVYDRRNLNTLTICERHYLEKAVGRLIRKFIDAGAYPVDAHLDHFLAMKVAGTQILVYYVDLERVKFNKLSKNMLRNRKLIKTLGRLIARLEWFRTSGGRINRSSMIRIGLAFFHEEGLGTLDKKLCRSVIQAARKYWYRRRFHIRGPYPLRSIDPNQ